MEQEIEIKQVMEIIKKHWKLFILFPILGALISGIISFYVLKPIYQTKATLIVGKKVPSAEEDFDNKSLEANRLLAKTYGEIAKSRTVRDQVISQLGLKITADQLYSKISVSQVEDTEILEISVTDTNPQIAADIANVIVWKFASSVVEIKKVDSVSIIDKAAIPTTPIKPNKMMNILIGLITGLAAAFVLSLFFEYLDNTVKTSKEAEELLGLSVLGVIPDYQYYKDNEGENNA